MKLFEQIKEDWRSHDKDWTLPGFRAVAVHRFGAWRMSIESDLLRKPLSFIYRMLYRRCRSVYNIEVPFTAELGRRVIIEHQGAIVIHGDCKIGDDCIIRQGVSLGVKSVKDLRGVPVLGKRVDIGAGAKLIGRIIIGDDVTIGANSVVTNDVPNNTTVVGIPARPIGRPSMLKREQEAERSSVLNLAPAAKAEAS